MTARRRREGKGEAERPAVPVERPLFEVQGSSAPALGSSPWMPPLPLFRDRDENTEPEEDGR